MMKGMGEPTQTRHVVGMAMLAGCCPLVLDVQLKERGGTATSPMAQGQVHATSSMPILHVYKIYYKFCCCQGRILCELWELTH